MGTTDFLSQLEAENKHLAEELAHISAYKRQIPRTGALPFSAQSGLVPPSAPTEPSVPTRPGGSPSSAGISRGMGASPRTTAAAKRVEGLREKLLARPPPYEPMSLGSVGNSTLSLGPNEDEDMRAHSAIVQPEPQDQEASGQLTGAGTAAKTAQTQRNEDIEKRHKSLQLRMAGMKKTIKNLEKLNQEKSETITLLQNTLAEKQKALDGLQNKANEDRNRTSLLSNSGLASGTAMLRARDKEHEARIKELETIVAKDKKQMMRLTEINSQLVAKVRGHGTTLDQSQAENEKLKARITELEDAAVVYKREIGGYPDFGLGL